MKYCFWTSGKYVCSHNIDEFTKTDNIFYVFSPYFFLTNEKKILIKPTGQSEISYIYIYVTYLQILAAGNGIQYLKNIHLIKCPIPNEILYRHMLYHFFLLPQANAFTHIRDKESSAYFCLLTQTILFCTYTRENYVPHGNVYFFILICHLS